MKIRVFERLVDIMIELINVKERKHYEKKTYITMDKENYQTCYLYAIVRQKNDDGYLKLELLKRIYTREEFIKKYNEFFRNDIICYGLEKLNEEKREKIYELSVSEIQNTKFRYLIDFLIDVNDYQIKNNIVDIPDYDLYKIKWKYAPSEIVKDIEKINFQVQDINNMIKK